MAGVEVVRWRLQERSAVTPEEPGETDKQRRKQRPGGDRDQSRPVFTRKLKGNDRTRIHTRARGRATAATGQTRRKRRNWPKPSQHARADNEQGRTGCPPHRLQTQ